MLRLFCIASLVLAGCLTVTGQAQSADKSKSRGTAHKKTLSKHHPQRRTNAEAAARLKAELTRNYHAIEQAYRDKKPEAIFAFWTPDFASWTPDERGKYHSTNRAKCEEYENSLFPGKANAPSHKYTLLAVQVKDNGKTAEVKVKDYFIRPLDEDLNADGTSYAKHIWVKTSQGWKWRADRFLPTPSDHLFVTTCAGISARVIEVNLMDPRVHVSVQVAAGMPRGSESLRTLLERTQPTIAVNGAYFCVTGLAPIGEIVVDGIRVSDPGMSTVLALMKNGHAVIRRGWHPTPEERANVAAMLTCGPALVLDGKIDCEPEAEGFQDPHIMGSTPRMGVGLTGDGKLLMVNTLQAVTFQKFARVMLALGCQSAMNLDAGSSQAMVYRGRTLRSPGRRLTNLLVVFVDKPLPERNVLAPHTAASLAPDFRDEPLPIQDPGNSMKADAIALRLCVDTMRAASEWCPATILRRADSRFDQHICPRHHEPLGDLH